MGNVRRPGGDQAATDQATGPRMSVPEAADALGILQDAVRSRIKRGTLATVRDGGRMFVALGGADQPSESNALTSQMQGEIDYLRGQLEADGQAHAEPGPEGGIAPARSHYPFLVPGQRTAPPVVAQDHRRPRRGGRPWTG